MILGPDGKPAERVDYYPNILSHWLGMYSIQKQVMKAGKMPKKQDLVLLAKKKLSRERAALCIERILGNKRCRMEIAQVLYSQNMSKVSGSKLAEYEDWLETLQVEVRELSRMAKAGLVSGGGGFGG